MDDEQSVDARIDVVAGEANSYVVGDDDEVIVIDPGDDADAVLAAVGEREVLAVICTHGHAAHVAGALEVVMEDEAPVALHPLDLRVWRQTHDDDPEIQMEDGGAFEVADVTLDVIHAPGHSRGSVIIYCDELSAAFTGDVVSADGPVPHEDEFPNWSRQVDAIGGHVLTLPAGTRLLPGHGRELSLAEAEREFNTWVTAGQDRLLAGSPEDAQ